MPNFISFAASIAGLAHGKNHALNHSRSLSDALRIEALALQKTDNYYKMWACFRLLLALRLKA